MDGNWKNVGEKLPKQPADELVQSVLEDIYERYELGFGVMVFERVSVGVPRADGTSRRHWGARCTCSMCGETFTAGYTTGGDKGVRLYMSEDGCTYPGYVDEQSEGVMPSDIIEYFDDEVINCPCCHMDVILTRKADLRYGRTYQCLQAEVVNVEDYTAVMYWRVNRHLDETGGDGVLFIPHAALLIDREGKLRGFYARSRSGSVTDVDWTPTDRSCDPMQQTYYSWEASCGRKIGGWTWSYGPELEGHTGEKTALDEFIGANGIWVGAYLNVWKQHPQVENLMRQGFAFAITDEIDGKLNGATEHYQLAKAPPIPWVDWREVKPHRMLGMSKETFRKVEGKYWSAKTARVWSRYRDLLHTTDAAEYDSIRKKIGACDVDKLLDMMQAGWDGFAPPRVVRYLEKQGQLDGGVDHLIDYRKMMNELGIAETEETCFPRDLLAAHDRIAQTLAKDAKVQYEKGFTSIWLELRALEWSDGELCIVVPRCNQDLIDEGNVLRHCVGGYGQRHCSGEPIFFVRHARRPERSYYTLNISLKGDEPREIQLHGYGNEHHGAHKEHRHSIPQKVRDFCDRWEREVLAPWFAEKKSVPKKRKRIA